MPKNRPNQKAVKAKRRQAASNVTRIPHAEQSRPKQAEPSQLSFIVDDNNQKTHVILPYDEYERLILNEMAASAIYQLEHSKPEDYVDYDDVVVEFARDIIVEARKKAKLTQKQLGDKVGMPQSQISRIERHPDRTHVRTLKKLAKALNVDVSVFLRHL